MKWKEIVNYIQPELLVYPSINNNNISEECNYYAVWEKQRGNQFWGDGGYYRIIQPEIRNPYLGPDLYNACPFLMIESRSYN